MLQFCIDDSKGGNDFALAGYVATVENWEHFSDEWQALLAASGLTYLKGHTLTRVLRDLEPQMQATQALFEIRDAPWQLASIETLASRGRALFGQADRAPGAQWRAAAVIDVGQDGDVHSRTHVARLRHQFGHCDQCRRPARPAES